MSGRLKCVICGAGLSIFLTSTSVHADIAGINPGAYTYNPGDAGTPPDVGPDFIQFTTGPNQRRSLWFNEPQDITEFTASFTYRATGIGASGNRQGISFVLQNDAGGLNTLGDPVGGLFGNSGLGYVGISPSAAITLELDTGPGATFSGFYTGGILGGGSTGIIPINAFSGEDIRVELAYSNPVLTVTFSDDEQQLPPRNYLVGSLESTLGSSSALVGFTASTANGGASQFLTDFEYNAVPEPTSVVLLIVGAVGMIRRRRC